MLTLLRWISRRSLRQLHGWGGVLGWLAYGLSARYRRDFRAQADLAGLTPQQRRDGIAQAGRLVAELPWLWLRPHDQSVNSFVRHEGAQLLDAALARGQGVILLTPHMGCFEIAAQAIAEALAGRSTLTVMYRPARQAWLRELEETARARPGLATAPAALSGVRQMLRALQRGEVVGLLPDQVPPEGQGVWAPFFGKPAYTMTLAARLAQQTGAATLLCWCERLPSAAGYTLRFSEMPGPWISASDAPGDNETQLQLANATLLNQAMEHLVRQKPGQYLWAYARYKQPRGLPAAPTGKVGP